MNKILEFLGVLFLVINFWWLIVGLFVYRRKSDRTFKHWLDDSDD